MRREGLWRMWLSVGLASLKSENYNIPLRIYIYNTYIYMYTHTLTLNPK